MHLFSHHQTFSCPRHRWRRVSRLLVLLSLTGSAVGNPITVENAKPGNPASQWEVGGTGDASIQGFATDISVNLGQTIRFKINTTALNYRLDIYRLGYYQGLGARLITTVLPSVPLPQVQPAPLTNATGLIDCGNWAESASWLVPTNAVSGIYLARLVRTDTSGASHIPFIVRDDAGQSDILFQTSDTTWQAYNPYGGRSLYDFFGTSQPRAHKVSYNRPFITRGNIQWDSLFTAEYPMVRWLEANGYHVSYLSGVDTDRYGTLLTNNHKAFFSVGHDEYWSGGQRGSVEAARNAGLHLAFFSGNEVFWKTRWEASIDGSNTPYRTLVCYKETHANAKIDPSPVWTGSWRDPRFSPPADGGRPENELTGTLYRVNGVSLNSLAVPAAYGKHRFWRNTSVATLSSNQAAVFAGGTLGFEWDECPDTSVRPDGLMRLSLAITNGVPVLLDNGSTYQTGTATHSLALYRHAGDALVFGAGTVHWSWGLDDNHDNVPAGGAADLRTQQATVNLLADMGVQPATLQTGLVAAVESTDHTAPSSAITHPLPGAALQPGVPVTIAGTATDLESRPWSVEVSTDDGATWRTAVGATNWSLVWTPARTGSIQLLCRAVDDSGNLQAVPTARTVTVVGPQVTIWDESFIPGKIDVGFDSPAELGVKFISKTAGVVLGLRFYKAEANQGPHTGRLWTSNGTLLATAAFSGETLTGWQQANFPAAVPINSNVVYLVSYHCPLGHSSGDLNFFTSTGATNGPLRAPAVSEAGPNGRYTYGPAGSFPTNTFFDANYWVDVVFSPKTPPGILWANVNNDLLTTSWLSISGEEYVLEYTDSLSGAGWTQLLPPITATSSTTLRTNHIGGAPRRFYRVRHLLD